MQAQLHLSVLDRFNITKTNPLPASVTVYQSNSVPGTGVMIKENLGGN